ncbi:hypothetical protein TNCV_3983661 [Trichonephila clavipes]|nr:hypothetical protein TNCV_3983661 [Trichonephila clavipes]
MDCYANYYALGQGWRTSGTMARDTIFWARHRSKRPVLQDLQVTSQALNQKVESTTNSLTDCEISAAAGLSAR